MYLDSTFRGWSSTLATRVRLVIAQLVLIFALALDFHGMFIPGAFVDIVSLNVCQHCSCTSVHILCTPANVVTSALAQVFSTTVIHGIESQHSFNLVSEQWLASNNTMRLLPRCGSLRRSKISRRTCSIVHPVER